MKKTFLLALISLIFISLCAAQEIQTEEKNVNAQTDFIADMQLALSSPEYPVTAGDIYTLAFLANNSPVSYSVAVDSTYKIRVANLTVLDATGKTFVELKRLVEKIVTENYHMSGVQFILTTPAVFNVTIKGEVNTTQIKQAWALTRLSKVIDGTFTNYSSTRDVTITSSTGKKKSYDLFKAKRLGELSEDPYVRPGDVITINRISRKFSLTGEVERPGTYELLAGENIQTLINLYGGGLTELADTSRIKLSRFLNDATSSSNSGEAFYLSKADIDSNFVLKNHDSINIASTTSLAPSIILEGIITLPSDIKEGQTEKDPNTSQKKAVTYLPGTNYADLIRANQGLFNEYSDLENAYIERAGKRLPINIETIIYDASFKSEYTPEPNDKLEIPFQQFFTKIHVIGEVVSTKEVNAWPLARLSTIISAEGTLTEFSSTRDIKVTSVDGQTKTYDLFKASRFGDLEQDPYIRAGETIEIQRISRKVSIDGSVERPGTYQLLKGENIQTLINLYASGLKELADTSRTKLIRSYDSESVTGKELYLSQTNIDEDFALVDRDAINIPSYTNLKPVVFMEGAIYASTGATLDTSTKIALTFTPGENYATLIRGNKEKFSASSDTENAYIIRGEKNIPININQILYDASTYSTEYVEPNDTLLIPFKQFFVSVSGAVENPDRYPYIPDRTWDYYIGLAGGFTTQNSLESISMVDLSGNKLSKKDFITPETTITANRNSFLYYFGQYAPLITTVLTCISTAISIIAITQ